MHQHASSWRVAAVGSCDAGLVDHAEWPKKVSVCKRTVARLLHGSSICVSSCVSSCVLVKMLIRMRLKHYDFHWFALLKIASFYYAIPSSRQESRVYPTKLRISKSKLFSVAHDKDAIPAKSETTDYISLKIGHVDRELAAKHTNEIAHRFIGMLTSVRWLGHG